MRLRPRPAALAVLLLCCAVAGAREQDYAAARDALVDSIAAEFATLGPALGARGLDAEVAAALRRTPRHAFVPEVLRAEAYEDRPLPIGQGQTISQPFVVAVMTQLLDVGPGDRVYELGTGSGYQAAVLAELGAEVWTVEIVPDLAARAGRVLGELGYRGVHVRAGDGYRGWPEAAPFDAIVVTAAIGHVPDPLVEQLAPGGRLVMPIGAPEGVQQLAVFVKESDGRLRRRDVLDVRFVPVTGPGAERR